MALKAFDYSCFMLQVFRYIFLIKLHERDLHSYIGCDILPQNIPSIYLPCILISFRNVHLKMKLPAIPLKRDGVSERNYAVANPASL